MKARLLLFSLLLLALLAAGCGGGGGSAGLNEDDAATVGSIHLSKTRVQDELSRAKASLKAQGATFPKEGTTEYESLKAQAIWLLVMEAARQAEAEKQGIDVTDAQVNQRITKIKKDYFDGSDEKYAAELKREGLTDAEARHLVKALLVSEQLQTKVTADTKVSDEDVHKYFVANKAQYPPSRDVQEILVGKNKEQLANQIYEQLRSGGDWKALAKKYSQDPGSKNQSGKFTAQKGKDVPDFDRVAFSLKTGELGKPVNTPEYGWFVIKAVSPVKQSTEKEAAPAIREQLLGEKKNQAITDWSSDLAKSICTGGKISYQVGYTPVPDPCAQYTSTTATTSP
jgi:parvulin-like peptidyl-prolyl isomerase